MNPFSIAVDLLVLIVGVAAGYLYHRFQSDRTRKGQEDKADNILRVANEQARLIETQARDSATKLVQASETELKERRVRTKQRI